MSEDEPGVEAWKANTSAFDRVRSVADTVSEPQAASTIAEEAHVAVNTARAHLQRLVDMGVLVQEDHDGTTVYAPDPLHTRMQTLRDLLERYNHDDLVQLKADLQEQIEAWRDEYDVESLAALRKRAAETDSAAETRDIQQTANDWELASYRLDIVEDAIENYATYSRDSPASA